MKWNPSLFFSMCSLLALFSLWLWRRQTDTASQYDESLLLLLALLLVAVITGTSLALYLLTS